MNDIDLWSGTINLFVIFGAVMALAILHYGLAVPNENKTEAVMNELLDVIRVDAKPDYTLHLTFENGEQRVFDMNRFMDKKPFVRLKGSPLFMKAFVDYGTVVWPGGIDIAPETLYDLSVPMKQGNSNESQ